MKQINNITYISSSELNTYAQCGLKHHIHYTLGVKGRMSSTLTMGVTFHKLAEEMINNYKNDDFKSLSDYKYLWSENYKEALSDAHINNTNMDVEIEQGNALLQQFYNHIKGDSLIEGLPPLSPSVTEYFAKAPITKKAGLLGYIDYIDSNGFLIDWKTTKRSPAKLKASISMQMKNYMVMMNINKTYVVFFIFKKKPAIKIISIELSSLDRERHTLILTQYLNDIISGGSKTPTGLYSDWACDWCMYSNVCITKAKSKGDIESLRKFYKVLLTKDSLTYEGYEYDLTDESHREHFINTFLTKHSTGETK